MSLYNRSSLIQVPSLYKDGTLVSTIPEDRSGDFTVARGSNLAATRIGEDGYIKKGYENLLLQSNRFDTTWTLTQAATLFPNQSGYDGTNDAWMFRLDALNNRTITQSVSVNGVSTFSVYAKKGTINIIKVRTAGSINYGREFDLFEGTVGGRVGTSPIDSKIENIGDGWYRCSIVVNASTTSVLIQAASTEIGQYLYIQDAQLNQGLVAYPYLETTDSPAQGGLLENSPRLDWSNGVPAVKLEEQRTNLISHSEYINGYGWANTGNYNLNFKFDSSILNPEGYYGSTYVDESDDNRGLIGGPGEGSKVCYSIFAKSSSNANFTFGSQFGQEFCRFNLNTGTLVFQGSGVDSTQVIDYGNGWRRYIINTTFTDEINNNYIYNYIKWDSTERAYLWGYQIEIASTPSSYIPTYGTTQTRSNEVISDNFDIPTTATIYNSFYSDIAETVFVLDQVFNVVEGLNKVAIAFSPTAVKISVGGSIVANATGTYDTTALSNIQLGSNNGTDYSNAPISGFYVFPEFLTDEELNSLTD